MRESLYRPFTKSNLYFDPRMTIDRASVLPFIFPTAKTKKENKVICVNVTPEKPFTCLVSDCLPNLGVTVGFGSPTQCFSFFTYKEDGTNRRENITDWALKAFQNHYGDKKISKWDIFYYIYGLLHHKEYCDKYQENLKRSLPHIPFAENFWTFADAGKQLADLHVNHESVAKYEGLTFKEKPDTPLNWDVEKMKLSKDKTQIQYNDFLTIEGIPAEVFGYRFGNRSAVEWIIDQYCVKIDARSGIRNDPNRAAEPQYIVDLIGRVITVSLETVKIIDGLPEKY